MDIDCCRFVTVSDCIIHSADDCITLRGNTGPLGKNKSCEYITITNCVLSTRCNAFRIGVGDGLIRRCNISNIIIHDTRTAICLVSQYSITSKGVGIEDIMFENLRLDCIRPFNIATTPRGIRPEEAKAISNISFFHVRGNAGKPSIIQGSRKGYMNNITFSDMELTFEESGDFIPHEKEIPVGEFVSGNPPAGFVIQNGDTVIFRNTKFSFRGKEWKHSIIMEDSREVRLEGSSLSLPILDDGVETAVCSGKQE